MTDDHPETDVFDMHQIIPDKDVTFRVSLRPKDHNPKWAENKWNKWKDIVWKDLREEVVQAEVAEGWGVLDEWNAKVRAMASEDQKNIALRCWALTYLINDTSIDTELTREKRKNCFYLEVWEGKHRLQGKPMALFCSAMNVITGGLIGPNTLTWSHLKKYGLVQLKKDDTETLPDYYQRCAKNNSLDFFRGHVQLMVHSVKSASSTEASAKAIVNAFRVKSICHQESKQDTTLKISFSNIADTMEQCLEQMKRLPKGYRPNFTHPRFVYPENTRNGSLVLSKTAETTTADDTASQPTHKVVNGRKQLDGNMVPNLVLNSAVRNYIRDPFNPANEAAFKEYFTTDGIDASGKVNSSVQMGPPFYVTLPSILEGRGADPGQITTEQVNNFLLLPKINYFVLADLYDTTTAKVIANQKMVDMVEYVMYFHLNPKEQGYGWLQPNRKILKEFYDDDIKDAYFVGDREWVIAGLHILRMCNAIFTISNNEKCGAKWHAKRNNEVKRLFITAINHAEGVSRRDLVSIIGVYSYLFLHSTTHCASLLLCVTIQECNFYSVPTSKRFWLSLITAWVKTSTISQLKVTP